MKYGEKMQGKDTGREDGHNHISYHGNTVSIEEG